MKKKTAILCLAFSFLAAWAQAAGLWSISASPLVADQSHSACSCAGQTDGRIVLSASGGQQPYAYSKNGGATYQSENAFSGLAAGNYTAVVKDAAGDSVTFFVLIEQPEPLGLDGSIKHVTGCFGDHNAYINFAAQGGTQPYQYTIDNWQTSQPTGEFYDLPAGEYFLQCRDTNHCTISQTITLTQPNQFKATGEISHINPCFGDDNGSITINASGGTEPYQFSIDGGVSYQGSAAFVDLSAGSYSVIAEDKNHCSETLNFTINQPDEVIIDDISAQNITPCYGDTTGKITILASGGTGNLSYSLDNEIFQTQNSFENLAAGNYTITVKDENNCSKNSPISLTQPDSIHLESLEKTDISCFGANDGSIQFTASGGTAPLRFSPNGETDFQYEDLISGLAPGNYQPTVKDANGCTTSRNLMLTQPDSIALSQTHEHILCHGAATGAIELLASGGAGTFTFSVGNGFQNSGTFSGLTAGSYTATAKDQTGCTQSTEIQIQQPPLLKIDSVNYANVSCNGDNTGQITIYASGGTPPFQFSIDDGENYAPSPNFPELYAGIYDIVVKDGNQCTKATQTDITEPEFNISYTKRDVTCAGDSDGRVVLNASGSNEPYRYAINGGSFQESGFFAQLPGAEYHFTIKDGGGCLKELDILVHEPQPLAYTNCSANVSCYGQDDGKLCFSPYGGTPPYQFSADGGTSFQTDSVFYPLVPGYYPCVITDAKNCAVTFSQIIYEPDSIAVSQVVATDLSCFGADDGTITITATGGTKPLSYSVDGGQNFSQDSILSGLQAGEYTALIRDARGCQKSRTININSPPEIVLQIDSLHHVTTCYGQSQGAVFASATGGSGNISFSIDNGENYQTQGTFTLLPAGNYTLLATDQSQCSTSTGFEIQQPLPLEIVSVHHTDVSNCNGNNSGTITINATGGTSPLSYSKDGANTFQNENIFTGLYAGEYALAVKDAHNCLKTAAESISEPPPIEFSVESENISCHGETDGEIGVQASGGTGTLRFSIDNGENFSNSTGYFTGLGAAVYQVRVRDANNCISPAHNAEVINPSEILFTEIDPTHVTCNNLNNGQIEIHATGGTGTLQYAIDNGFSQPQGLFTGLSPGNHTVQAVDENFCVAEQDVFIKGSDANCIEIPNAFTPNSDGINDLWHIKYLELYEGASVQIYDRYGKMVAKVRASEPGWDGKTDNVPLPAGTYWYVINLNNGAEVITGHVALVR